MDLTIGRHTILVGDVRERLRDLPDDSVHCCITSPPYFGLRDYGVSGQIGLDPFLGSGTTMLVADQLGRTCIGVELNPEYAAMAKKRVYDASPLQLLGAY